MAPASEHQPQHRARGRPQGHPDRDLAPALGHHQRHDAIDAQRSEQHRNRLPAMPMHQPLQPTVARVPGVRRFHGGGGDRQRPVDALHQIAGLRRDRRRDPRQLRTASVRSRAGASGRYI